MATRRTFGHVRKLPSGRWQASYLDEHTRGRIGAPWTFASKADANLWLASVETDLARGEHLQPELARRPFGEWADEWLHSLHVRPKTYVGYESSVRNHVLPVFVDRPIADITYRDCKAFVDELLRDGLAPGTVGEARKILRLVLREALRSDAIRRNPADGLRIPRGVREEMMFLSPAEVMQLANEIANPPQPHPIPARRGPLTVCSSGWLRGAACARERSPPFAWGGSTAGPGASRSPSRSRRSTARSSMARPEPTPAAPSTSPCSSPANWPPTSTGERVT